MLAPAESEPKFMDMEQGESVTKVDKHTVLIDQWGQEVQLIIYETKNGTLKGLGLAFS